MVKREQEQYIVSVKINIVEKYFHWWPYFCYRLWITKRIVIGKSDRDKNIYVNNIYLIVICSTKN